MLVERFSEVIQHFGCSPHSSSYGVCVPTKRSKKKRGMKWTTDFPGTPNCLSLQCHHSELLYKISPTHNILILPSVHLNYTVFKPYLKSHFLHEIFFNCCWPHISLIPVDFHFSYSSPCSIPLIFSWTNMAHLMFCFLKFKCALRAEAML